MKILDFRLEGDSPTSADASALSAFTSAAGGTPEIRFSHLRMKFSVGETPMD